MISAPALLLLHFNTMRDPVAPHLSGSNPKEAQSWVSSEDGTQAAAPLPGQPFATHQAVIPSAQAPK